MVLFPGGEGVGGLGGLGWNDITLPPPQSETPGPPVGPGRVFFSLRRFLERRDNVLVFPGMQFFFLSAMFSIAL